MKKILFLGPEVSDFINPLAGKLKELGYVVDLLENRKIPRNNPSISESYSHIINYNELADRKLIFIKALKYLFTSEFYKNFSKTISLNYLDGKCRIMNSLKNALKIQHSKEIFSPILNKYDIINFHSLYPETLSYIKYIEPKKKVILSFWGSDLFQVFGLRWYYEQINALDRADLITVHSDDMKRVVMSKFGSELQSKIVPILFGLEDEVLDEIDKAKKIKPHNHFFQKYNIPENKINITIGYCGNTICNHLYIIDELLNIDPSIKEKIHLLVPMTYGYFTKEYLDAVKIKITESGISFTLFTDYLSPDELMQLRVTSDIMIMMNKSDALSASVCEAIYAENLLISAIWLPYSPLRAVKIFFNETDFSELREIVTYSVNNIIEIKPKLTDNPERIRRLVSFNNNFNKWTRIFESL